MSVYSFMVLLLGLCAVECAIVPDKSEEDTINEDGDFSAKQAMLLSKLSALNSTNTSFLEASLNGATYGNCAEIQEAGFSDDGVYLIYPTPTTVAVVYCDLTTEGGGWTIFQKRYDGSVDFYLKYEPYQDGFGNVAGEYWLGLDHIRSLVEQAGQELRVDMEDVDGATPYAKYNTFSVMSADDGYELSIGVYSGTAGDSLGSMHSGERFSTHDRDQDSSSLNCAEAYLGAWWYKSCLRSNLNGPYHKDGVSPSYRGLNWHHWKNSATASMLKSEMKMRPSNFATCGASKNTQNRGI